MCAQEPLEVKRASNPPELELQVIVSYDMDAGNQAQVLYKSSKCCHLASPILLKFLQNFPKISNLNIT